MRFLNDVHGRKINKTIVPAGSSLKETLENFHSVRGNIPEMDESCLLTFWDCKLTMIAGQLVEGDDVRLIKDHIMTLYDDNVGDRFACVYLVASCLEQMESELCRYERTGGEESCMVPEKDGERKRAILIELIYKKIFGGNKIDRTAKSESLEQASSIAVAGVDDGLYLELWSDDLEIRDTSFLLRWGYYSFNESLREVVRELEDDDNKEWVKKIWTISMICRTRYIQEDCPLGRLK